MCRFYDRAHGRINTENKKDKKKEKKIMKKTVRNLIIGAVMAFGVCATAFADTQYVQTTMNFRSGASTSARIIGSVPAGAQVEVLQLKNGWNLIRYNGVTGYIHGGNLGYSYTVKKASNANTKTSTQQYYDNNWTRNAQNMSTTQEGSYKTVYVESGYLALRTNPAFDDNNEIGELYTGDAVQILGSTSGSYVFVYSPKYGCTGWVNAGFLA